MARNTRITVDEVKAAANEMNSKGLKPTVIKLRETLGRGSYSTIQSFLDEWEAPNEAQAEAPDVPESLSALIPGIWRTCYAEAEALINEKMQEIKQKLGETKDDLETTKRAVNSLESENETLENDLEVAKEELAKQCKKLQAAENLNERLNVRCDELQKTLSEMRAENISAREHIWRESEAVNAAMQRALDAETKLAIVNEKNNNPQPPHWAEQVNTRSEPKGGKKTSKKLKAEDKETLEALGQQRIDQ